MTDSKQSFFLVYAESGHSWHEPDISSFELVKASSLDEAQAYEWETRCEYASDGASDEDYDDEGGMEWGDHVESSTTGCTLEYDPTNHEHALLTGYEDERPEHKVALIKQAEERAEHAQQCYLHALTYYESELARLNQRLERDKQRAVEAKAQLRALLGE